MVVRADRVGVDWGRSKGGAVMTQENVDLDRCSYPEKRDPDSEFCSNVEVIVQSVSRQRTSTPLSTFQDVVY